MIAPGYRRCAQVRGGVRGIAREAFGGVFSLCVFQLNTHTHCFEIQEAAP